MTAPSRRVGWCPGALRPMASRDGLVLRIKPRGGRLTLAAARAILEVGRRHGSGTFELTQRGNLQVRGVMEGDLPSALAPLEKLGLLDPGPEAEAVRNVVASPCPGLDPAAVLDIGPAVAALEARLTETPALHGLPAKFGFLVDDGGAYGLAAVSADIRFEAWNDGDRPAFAVRLGGDDEAAGRCEVSGVADAAEALARIFLDACQCDPALRRMPGLVARRGAAALLREAGLAPCRAPRPAAAPLRAIVGPHSFALGVGAPFGRMAAAQVEALLDAAEAGGAQGLFLTPWRVVLMPGLARPEAAAAACAAAGLIVDPADMRLRVAACAGAPGCPRGTTPVLDHAAHLARRLAAAGDSIVLHVSGCGKGCAHAGEAPLTLVAHDGRYDLVVDGRAADAPFLRDLSFEEAARCVKASAGLERVA